MKLIDLTLPDIIKRNRSRQPVSMPSWCTAHPETLAAILHCYRSDDAPILIEATCNQVNQFGGYTGMTPADFVGFVHEVAHAQGVNPARIILGGDHLGPNPWRTEPSVHAMDKACDMVAAFVEAGFSKIHLDASMACNGEILTEVEMADRAARLCKVAETAGLGRSLSYIIGTEVPVPGGETSQSHGLAVTAPSDALRTLDLHRTAFVTQGLQGAFERVLGLVVQPGVDFGNAQIMAYDRPKATALVASAQALGGPLFEAHSTDYQSEGALGALVQDHFAILKVGPELTFAYRQAVMALEQLEHLLGMPPSGVTAALLAAMHLRPADWRPYIAAGTDEETLMLYGLSDRLRYYWPDPDVQAAQNRLFAALRGAEPAPGLLAQITGGLVRQTDPTTLPETVIRQMVGAVVQKYRSATGV